MRPHLHLPLWRADGPRTTATLLFWASLTIYLASRSLEDVYPMLVWVRVMSEAGTVGALADWFAVVALFRHPLGLPIPHTAIIPRRKDQLGASLGGFISEHFLDPVVVRIRLQSFDLPGRLASLLSADGTRRKMILSITRAVARETSPDILLSALRSLAVPSVPIPGPTPMQRFLERLLHAPAGDVAVGGVLEGARSWILRSEDFLRSRFDARAPWWVPAGMRESLAERVIHAVTDLLAEAARDRAHPLRGRLRSALLAAAHKLDDGKCAGEAQGDMDELLRFLALEASDLLERLGNEGSAEFNALDARIVAFAGRLAEDEEVQARVQQTAQQVACTAAGAFREDFAQLVRRTVEGWDSADASAKLEAAVGADLQYIRINGTLIGALAGLALHLLGLLL